MRVSVGSGGKRRQSCALCQGAEQGLNVSAPRMYLLQVCGHGLLPQPSKAAMCQLMHSSRAPGAIMSHMACTSCPQQDWQPLSDRSVIRGVA